MRNFFCIFKNMILKPEKIIKRIIKAVGEGQAVLVIGAWLPELIKGIKENRNSISIESSTENLEDNSFTRVVIDYSLINSRGLWPQAPIFFSEACRLLLPTGMIIISANCEDGILDKLFKFFKKDYIREGQGIKKIKPKILQDQIHDNGFLIDGYYGYPGGHLLMMAQIHNKEVTTLFSSDKQETVPSTVII